LQKNINNHFNRIYNRDIQCIKNKKLNKIIIKNKLIQIIIDLVLVYRYKKTHFQKYLKKLKHQNIKIFFQILKILKVKKVLIDLKINHKYYYNQKINIKLMKKTNKIIVI
jgi:hypothetical protein